MSTNTNPRADAKLKRLPAERQAAIAEKALEPDMTQAKVVAWLRADGVKTSVAALSEFLSWYSLGQQLRNNESTVAALLEDLKKQDPGLSAESLERAGQMFFSALAIETKDSLTWKRVQDSKLRLGVLQLNKQKFEFDAAKAALKIWPSIKQISSDKALSETDKVEAVRKKLFGVIPK